MDSNGGSYPILQCEFCYSSRRRYHWRHCWCLTSHIGSTLSWRHIHYSSPLSVSQLLSTDCPLSILWLGIPVPRCAESLNDDSSGRREAELSIYGISDFMRVMKTRCEQVSFTLVTTKVFAKTAINALGPNDLSFRDTSIIPSLMGTQGLQKVLVCCSNISAP